VYTTHICNTANTAHCVSAHTVHTVHNYTVHTLGGMIPSGIPRSPGATLFDMSTATIKTQPQTDNDSTLMTDWLKLYGNIPCSTSFFANKITSDFAMLFVQNRIQTVGPHKLINRALIVNCNCPAAWHTAATGPRYFAGPPQRAHAYPAW